MKRGYVMKDANYPIFFVLHSQTRAGNWNVLRFSASFSHGMADRITRSYVRSLKLIGTNYKYLGQEPEL